MSYGGYEAYGNDDFGGGGGGGGFMEGSQGGSQNTPSKRGGGGGGRGSREAQGLLPITAKQLVNRVTSDDDVIRIDGQEVTNVKLVGILSNVTPHSTNVNFQLDDGTGVIEGRMFLHADDADYAENEVSKLRDGIYARVVGNLRIFQERVSLSAFTVTPIEDFNEVTHHFLDAIYVHCYNTKGPLQGASGGAAAAGNSFNTPVKGENNGFNVPVGQQAWNQGSSSYMGGGGMDYGMMDSNFSPEQKAILDVLGTCTSDRGLKIDQIFTDLRGQMTEDQLRGALNYLTSEGHVYSTIDENHFKRTA